jgi:hypothetical protein
MRCDKYQLVQACRSASRIGISVDVTASHNGGRIKRIQFNPNNLFNLCGPETFSSEYAARPVLGGSVPMVGEFRKRELKLKLRPDALGRKCPSYSVARNNRCTSYRGF